ncbi:Leucine-rich repeat containing protein [Entamoeba marina]
MYFNHYKLPFFASVALYIPDFPTLVTFVQVNKQCQRSLLSIKTNPFYMKNKERNIHSCIAFIKELTLFRETSIHYILMEYLHNIRLEQVMNTIKELKISSIKPSELHILNGYENKITDLSMVLNAEQINFSNFYMLDKLHLTLTSHCKITSLFPCFNQTLSFLMIKVIRKSIVKDVINDLAMYHLFKNVVVESPCNIDSKKLNITHICNGIITPLNTNCLFVNGMQIQLRSLQNGYDISHIDKIMKLYYPTSLTLLIDNKNSINATTAISEIDLNTIPLDEPFTTTQVIRSSPLTTTSQELKDKESWDELILIPNDSKSQLPNKPILDLTKYQQLVNVKTIPENIIEVKMNSIEKKVDAIKSVKEDDITTQKVISLSRRNLDLSNELVTNIKLSNCKLLQKTTFPSTLQQLTLDHCEIALYKTGSVFSIPTTVTSLSIKGNLEQQLLHLENIPLIELDLQSTSQITTKYPLTLTKLTLSNINASEILNLNDCISLKKIICSYCARVNIIIPFLDTLQAESSFIHIKNTCPVHIDTVKLFRCQVGSLRKINCKSLYCFTDVNDDVDPLLSNNFVIRPPSRLLKPSPVSPLLVPNPVYVKSPITSQTIDQTASHTDSDITTSVSPYIKPPSTSFRPSSTSFYTVIDYQNKEKHPVVN